MAEKDKLNEELLDYRIKKLEDAVISLGGMEKTLMKWDSKFSTSNIWESYSLHVERLEQFEKRLTIIEKLVYELDKFKWKAVGVLSVIILIVQLFGGAVTEKFLKEPKSSAPMSQVANPYTFPNK